MYRKLKTIKTTDEFLALSNKEGVIEYVGDLHIQCDVPWSCVKEIFIFM